MKSSADEQGVVEFALWSPSGSKDNVPCFSVNSKYKKVGNNEQAYLINANNTLLLRMGFRQHPLIHFVKVDIDYAETIVDDNNDNLLVL